MPRSMPEQVAASIGLEEGHCMVQDVRISYATLSGAADDEQLQSAFDRALARVRRDWLGAEVPPFIDGEEIYAGETLDSFSPFATGLHLCAAQKGDVEDAREAIEAAAAAFPTWRRTPWQERVAMVRDVARRLSTTTALAREADFRSLRVQSPTRSKDAHRTIPDLSSIVMQTSEVS